MNYLFSSIVFSCLFGLIAHSQEPRLVLPIGHTEYLNSVAFSPDGKLALTASYDGTARIYEVSSRKELHVLSGHTQGIKTAVFSPNGILVLTASGDSTIRIYEASTGQERKINFGRFSSNVESAVFSPNGKLVLTSGDSARIFDFLTGKQLPFSSDHKEFVKSAVFSPDGTLVLTTSNDNTSRIYEVSTSYCKQILSQPNGSVNTSVFSPDGKFVLTANDDGTAKIYDVSSGICLDSLFIDSCRVNSAVFSPDGTLILTASGDSTVRIYDASSLAQLDIKRNILQNVFSAVFSPDGKLILTANNDGTAHIYEVSSDNKPRVLSGSSNEVISAEYSSDGKLLLTLCFDKTVSIFEVSSGKRIQHIRSQSGSINSAVFSPNGKLVLTTGDTARIFEVSSGKQLPFSSDHLNNIKSAVFSPDGTMVLTAFGNTARIHEVSTGNKLQTLKGHKGTLESTLFSADGKMALTTSTDGTAHIYKVSTGKRIKRLKGRFFQISSAVFSPDNKTALTINKDTAPSVFNVTNGKVLHVLNGHTQGLKSVSYSQDGKFALTASIDCTARLFDVSTGDSIRVFTGHKDKINSAVFSPDGKLILTTSDDWTARIYDIKGDSLVHELKGHKREIATGLFSADGKTVLTIGADHQSILWDATTGKKLYTRIHLNNDDWLVYDEQYHFDGTEGAIEKLYFTCDLEVIELSQVKQSLRVRNLVEKIMNKEDLTGYKKISDLNICGKLPIVKDSAIQDQNNYSFTIQERSAQIVRIEVYVDKKRVKIINPNQLEWKEKYAVLQLNKEEIEAEFKPGQDNSVKVQVVALIEGEEIPSRGVSLVVEDQRERKEPNFYGVFVGVDAYNDEQLSLKFPVDDALSLSKTVEAGVSEWLGSEHVKVYNIHSEYSPEKNNGFGTPTRSTIRRALEEIARVAEPQDVLLVFLAGHGTMGEKTKQQFTFLTSEATNENPIGITTDTLFSWIGTDGPFQLKANKAILILDACNSAQLLNDISNRNSSEDRQKQLDQLSNKGMFILSASAPNHYAYEHPKLEHGLLTYSLLRVLKQNTNIYVDGEYVNMTKWFAETGRDLDNLTGELGLEQEATSSGTGDFPLLELNEVIRESIELAEEKQQIYFESAENVSDESSNHELIEHLISKCSDDETLKKCFYLNDKYTENTTQIKLKYTIKGKTIQCRILMFKNNQKTEFVITGSADDWPAVEDDILKELKLRLCKN